MAPKISICIPTFNGARHLGTALESILSQSFENFELIVVDDMSDDGTYELLRRYAKNDKRIHVSRGPDHVGLFENYNRCMLRAKGEYIKLLAQDDVLAEDALTIMEHVLHTKEEVFSVGCARNIISPEGTLMRVASGYDRSAKISGRKAIRDMLMSLSNDIADPSSMMFRRKVVGTGFSGKYSYLTLEFWCRLFNYGSFYHINKPLCFQRQHTGQAGSQLVTSFLHLADYLQLVQDFETQVDRVGLDKAEWKQRVSEVMLDNVRLCIDYMRITQQASNAAAAQVSQPLNRQQAEQLIQSYSSLAHWLSHEFITNQNLANKLKSEKVTDMNQIISLSTTIGRLNSEKNSALAQVASLSKIIEAQAEELNNLKNRTISERAKRAFRSFNTRMKAPHPRPL